MRLDAFRPLPALLCAGLVLQSATGLAQTLPAAPATPPAQDQTVTLSPFIIATERETGWSANETLSATRTKQALKDVPVNIDAITADFIEDLGLYTADEVANFVANAYAPPTVTSSRAARPRSSPSVPL
ncbi:MAG: hypothetical protein LW690_12340 [Opitutaceae bacterium]|nr:hypothetical protein [Opitutaceae bacterium]